jgi:hypothetical protein
VAGTVAGAGPGATTVPTTGDAACPTALAQGHPALIEAAVDLGVGRAAPLADLGVVEARRVESDRRPLVGLERRQAGAGLGPLGLGSSLYERVGLEPGGVRRRGYTGCMSREAWPTVPEDQRWVIEEIEEMLAESTQTPGQLIDRAEELRAKARATDIQGFREAWLALADRYQETAAA